MKKVLKFVTLALVSTGLLATTGCGNDGSAVDGEGELVVYSSRNENFVQPLLDKFTEETGIEVSALHGADPLQLQEEAGNVQADIFISNDLGALGYLHNEGLLEGSNPEGIDTIPADFKADDNAYFAISARSRGFIYNKDLITEEEMPTSIEDLFDAEWANVENGYAITRGGNGGMLGNVSALRYEWGDERTSEWVASIRENAAGIYEGHGDIRRAVGEGLHSFGLVNNYYFHQQLLEPNNNNVGFIYLDQGEGEMGVIANAAGVGLVNDGPNSDNALVFLEWVLQPENQVAFVGESLELLINSEYGASYPEEVEPHIVEFTDLKVQDMPLKELGNYFQGTRELIENSGLDLDLR
ncbi:extracellular solute-binding protein [Evansella cellulosilytica]|uniref:Extracellular solute-binding protein family 1 n=1 Tax=Evansella cellulosilytica (strain ATCC 21833 / DSM 2522 / FERM P-1141 / JCM 9156 / N-4) TaxID=649639 RepID=E6TQT4_EVAC2|nr:extracellular solute-binding protein [Evansella cellulosilytica]ADU31709.1 extracellular solute-binding protein family 1 [Evansella cellulosilytica DSM 2522]